MRALLIVILSACGASPPPEPSAADDPARPPLRLEWRAEQAENDEVTVSLVVEGKSIELGTLPAATETERGTPRTCALRSHPQRTEITCGELASSYAAELIGDELVISRVDSAGTANAHEKAQEVKRLPVFAGSLSVKPYAMPD